ncbi:hypothetical protein GCM10027174_33850 [Salinifilum aidingensis]
MPDPRVPYAEFLIEAELDPDRGWGMLRQLWHERTTDPQDYQRAAEIHEELGFLQEALTWSNAGVARCCPQPFDPWFADLREDVELFALLDGRRRQRRALEQPADELDELVEASRGDVAESLAPRPQQDTPPLVPYWPEGEFDEALRRWPETLRPVTPHGQDEDAPRTHTEHRRAVERELRASAAGETPRVVPLSTEEFGAFGSGAGTGDVLLLLERYMLVWDEAGSGRCSSSVSRPMTIRVIARRSTRESRPARGRFAPSTGLLPVIIAR